MAQNKIRVRLKSYDSTIIDAAAAKVVGESATEIIEEDEITKVPLSLCLFCL